VPEARVEEHARRSYEKLSPGPGRAAADVEAHQRRRISAALVELVDERGLDAVTVRELAALARVSSRSFYQRFSDLEDCFQQTTDSIMLRGAGRIATAAAAGGDWEQRLQLGFEALAAALVESPAAARFTLCNACRVGPPALEQMRRLESAFEEMLAEGLLSYPDGPGLPPLVVEGVVPGVARASCGFLEQGRADAGTFGGELRGWLLAYRGVPAERIVDLDRAASRAGEVDPQHSSSSKHQRDELRSQGDRSLILSGISKLVATDGYAGLTLTSICAATGLSRGRFKRAFAGVDECFAAMVELHVDAAFAEAYRARDGARSRGGGVYRLIESLCRRIAGDPSLARLCFVDVYAAGAAGAACRERFMGELDWAVTETGADLDTAAKASVGAVWGVMRRRVASGRQRSLERVSASLAFLLLAPAMGAEAARSTIENECEGAVRKHCGEKLDHSSNRGDGHLSSGGAASRPLALQGG
jgi:AcrR family transcriptional regulator